MDVPYCDAPSELKREEEGESNSIPSDFIVESISIKFCSMIHT